MVLYEYRLADAEGRKVGGTGAQALVVLRGTPT